MIGAAATIAFSTGDRRKVVLIERPAGLASGKATRPVPPDHHGSVPDRSNSACQICRGM